MNLKSTATVTKPTIMKVTSDETILGCMMEMASNYGEYKSDVATVLDSLGNLLRHHDLTFSKVINVSYVWLMMASPLQLSIDELVRLIKAMHDNALAGISDGDDGDDHDVEEFANWLQAKCQVPPANIGASMMAAIDEFKVKYPIDDDEFMFSVMKNRLLINSLYLDDINIEGITPIINSASFHKWYRGYYRPFKYYWDNYGSLTDEAVKYHQLAGDNDAIFTQLISPMGSLTSEKLATGNWLHHVIIPMLVYHDDFSPLINWCFNDENISTKNYALWYTTIKQLVDSDIEIDKFNPLVSKFIAFCYFDNGSEKSIDMVKHFDDIKSTVLLLIPLVPTVHHVKSTDIIYRDDETFDNLDDFIQQSSLRPLIQVSKDNLISLSEMIESCIKLYPINQLTINKFLTLKYGQNATPDIYKKEISKILIGITPHNASTLINSLALFKDIFIGDDDDINELIIDRYLFNNLFDLIGDNIDTNRTGVDRAVLYKLLLKKLWECINQSSSLDDAKYGYANQCMELIDKLTLSSPQKEEIIRLKHLLKVFHNVKNFRFRSVISPGEILKKYGTLPNYQELQDLTLDVEIISPMGLITNILENNPKSYLAFEKLFKILNDFLIYLHNDVNSNYYFNRLMSACIESSLIDNNFTYAYNKAVELLEFSNDKGENINNMWLTFYQIGKYQTPDWFDEEFSHNLPILTKKASILSNYLLVINRSEITVDNSRLIIDLWDKINGQIDLIMKTIHHDTQPQFSSSSWRGTSPLAGANELLTEATHTTNQASEKLSNLFVSGLGWAIGANQH